MTGKNDGMRSVLFGYRFIILTNNFEEITGSLFLLFKFFQFFS